MTTTIADHRLTAAEIRTLDEMREYLHRHGGDSVTDPNSSPMGDGRWVPLLEIFPRRSNQGTASRRTAHRLYEAGVLSACEIGWRNFEVKLTPWLSAPSSSRPAVAPPSDQEPIL
jgi:hypothetical protein